MIKFLEEHPYFMEPMFYILIVIPLGAIIYLLLSEGLDRARK